MKNKVTLLPILLLVILGLILVVDLFFHRGTFTAHDIETNIVYFGAFFDSLLEGNIFPRWSANLANLYGSPTSMFFYPFSYYMASLIRILGFSLIDTMKIYIFMTFILSALFMYIWLKNHFPTVPSFIGAFLYIYAPYRINDIYARGSVAENTAFVFLPLVAEAFFLLWQKTNLKRSVILALSFSALILSHPFIFVVFLPFYASYLIILNIDLKKMINVLISAVFSITLTSFYIVPLFLENKYTHYDISPFNGNGYFMQFLDFKKLLLPIWTFIDTKGKIEYQTYQIGILQLVLFLFCILLVIINIWRKKINLKQNKFFIIAFINFILSMFLMLPISDFIYKGFPFLQRIEFPWRYLSLNLFSLSLLTTSSMLLFRNQLQKMLSVLIVIFAIILYLPHAKGHDYKIAADDYYLYSIRENTDGFATLPRWAAQPDIYERIGSRYKIIDGKATITTLKRTSTKHIYQIKAEEDSRMLDATFYFPGWQVFINDKPTEIEFQDPNFRGLISYNIPKGEHYVEVVFNQTKVRKLADTVTLVTLIVLFILYSYGEKIQKSFHRNPRL